MAIKTKLLNMSKKCLKSFIACSFLLLIIIISYYFFYSYFDIAIGLWSRLTKQNSKVLDYDEFCTQRGSTQKDLRKVKQHSEANASCVSEGFHFGFQFLIGPCGIRLKEYMS